MKYRDEIDGLRAFAIIFLILYQSQFIIFGKDWFKGGLLGVDIFFVISGYLITKTILHELNNTNNFNIIYFIEKRFRRLFPMLLVSLVVFIPFAWIKLLPIELIQFCKNMFSSITFISNFHIYFFYFYLFVH